uniref:Uncharacterized protein n=1 Tax=Xiphophorus couchianus TaxID=32473 RepID=A0A3B5MNU7_9TELE
MKLAGVFLVLSMVVLMAEPGEAFFRHFVRRIWQLCLKYSIIYHKQILYISIEYNLTNTKWYITKPETGHGKNKKKSNPD